MAGAYGVWGLTSRTNFQFYPPSGGYKTYHTERTGKGEPEGSRHLVFMTCVATDMTRNIDKPRAPNREGW